MRTGWIFWTGILIFSLPAVCGTFRYEPARCNCNGKSHQCTVDAVGVRCLNCLDNTDGRNCERCKTGYFRQRAGDQCQPCSCNPLGSVSSQCDSNGRCSCKPGILGEKCDRCQSGTRLTQTGCTGRCSLGINGQLTDNPAECLSCFCYGHSTDCSSADGYTAHSITSTFNSNPEGWLAAFRKGSSVQFGWSQRHRDIEVTSRDNIPVYLYAPESFLGNQMLSYGQNLSFSFRVDRGHRQPSTTDVVLEGAGLKVAAPLADLRRSLPCGQKITYSFKLDEQPQSKWQPQLTALQFQKLLQNLTAIKIRGTYGENSRGYLDDVTLVSARRGSGVPAWWVERCNCPKGYNGQFCEKCAPGFKRTPPSSGPFSECVPCNCRGGSCDPETGDCFSGDENRGDVSCPPGSYKDPRNPGSCLVCPCALGSSCSVNPSTLEVKCDQCPAGITGPRCDVCEDGFYGDPQGLNRLPRPCQRCQCNGHIDLNAVGNCNRLTGECLKCIHNTTGFYCEHCLEGFYRSPYLVDPTQTCSPCNCNPLGSLSNRCNNIGQCSCREGFEGLKCERSACPTCYDPIKYQIERYSRKLRDIEALFTNIQNGQVPVNDVEMEKTLAEAEKLVANMEQNTGKLSVSEKELQTRVSNIKSTQSVQARNLAAVSRTVDGMTLQNQQYQRQVSNIKQLINDARQKLDLAKLEIRRVELPAQDERPGVSTNSLSSLVQTATSLAKSHKDEANKIEQTAKSSLLDVDRALSLMRNVINGENKVTEVIGDLRAQYNRDVAKVKDLENRAASVSSGAQAESRTATEALNEIISLERLIPDSIQREIQNVKSSADSLKRRAEEQLSDYRTLQGGITDAKNQARDLLLKGKADQQRHDQLLARANAAKAEAVASLRDIQMNVNGVEQVLGNLKDFDGQLSTNKAEADRAIRRIPLIGNIIQEAVQSNTKTESILGNTEGDINEAQMKVGELKNIVEQMEGAVSTLKGSNGLLSEATTLKNSLSDLQFQTLATVRDLTAERNKANEEKEEAKRAIRQATAAYNKAVDSRKAVGATLRTINSLLNTLDSSGGVDETRLAELQESISNARSTVTTLQPRLDNLVQMEFTQQERIRSLNRDIDIIMEDIQNLKTIQSTIPKGCFNSPPIERP
ncbi:laminin subunit gamma-2 isoform X1 [Lepisosteus oculatus]|uniref:laminin subunit gamma-2 isoform X1 n=1 Tax=Lepisosteus oculatus TaxID=7918 RepID=UPI003715642F